MESDTSGSRTSRTAVYMPRDLLVGHGYMVLRVAQSHTHEPIGINLIAWNNLGDTRFIYVKSSRKGSTRNDIEALSRLSKQCRYPGSPEFWILDKDGWTRYLIKAGGAVPLTEFS
ncbi:MAG: hypothetical protein LUQ50_15290 [Methanospirillum sp.]|uniref:hypothetical protein n=1 Tax=Methanospirillum sp. TaxID=45200 RepID=UPI002374033D|nr:hypothetical protein [Methanospirillum sp.]MDD1730418.1 hypothetical protein [Methanospirillum sp.]